ncbi:MAG: Sec-independent protein translocase subunit TatA [Sphingomonas oligoaromativorans]|uniref:Sec-independent protein translocase subunit TatA n=1 Tax=Sphingomonas oligoaromativorans TaxID=575322 RepID=UPI001420FFEB|nr:Sec-independent protein translocase subunit TatA [Sphingomonas oligoaromativorans]NIJ33826.1 sec-independent protein translocase protein TatA [Sphingomonas oligoaromativorans]
MGFGSPIHWIILGIIAIVLFGGGRFPSMMGDVAKGLKSFKKGMADEDDDQPKPAQRLQAQAPLEPNADRDLQPMPEDRPRT